MSSDGLFDDVQYDDAFFEELERVESTKVASTSTQAAQPKRASSVISISDEEFDLTFDFDDAVLDDVEEQAERSNTRPWPGRSAPRQTTLFGDILPTSTSATPESSKQRKRFGQQAPKVKKWDHTGFAKSGVRKSKGKAKAPFRNEDEEEEGEEIEFDQFPSPEVSTLRPPLPMKLQPDLLEAKRWIYPLNQSKRDYQYNIVKHCLFDNTIVALPTGLGKTFIAGVVMLNYYRWFPEGKVVFVAPTKPLVAQQIEASHKTCGIPGSDAVELTGHNPKPMRARAWKEKRVFYMTPQTFINDLMSQNCDVRSMILLVIDEAHRATGDYAYNQIVRYMMAHNPHFRLLALTATPGSNAEAVQNLVDGLHISRIEIRDENSLDLKPYLHEKTVEQHIIRMTADINVVKGLLVKLMEGYMKGVVSAGVLRGGDMAKMHPYAFQGRMQSLQPHQRGQLPALSMLSALARVMGYLIEGTMKMCHRALADLAAEEDGPKASKGKKGAKLRADSNFQAALKQLEYHNARGFPIHPKMEKLKALILQHLTERLPDEPDASSEPTSTKIMVFATNRDCVEEIVVTLNEERPMIRASRFIGQGTDKQGRKGLAQKEQLDVIKRFKADEFNVLVATSIGEEGLDIGEVDLIVCYDAQKTPIRMLQRLGRTGRKRAGVVHVLLSENREELNMDKAKDTYKHVQNTILMGQQLELYADVERLLPDHIDPKPLEKAMEIQEYVREEPSKKVSTGARTSSDGKKRKRNADIRRNIPAGASTGFVNVKDLLVKGKMKSRKKEPTPDLSEAGEDDEVDRELEMGLEALNRRAATDVTNQTKTNAKGKAIAKERGTLKKAKTLTGGECARKTKKKPIPADPTSSQMKDDSDDLAIERGLSSILSPERRRRRKKRRLEEESDGSQMDVGIEKNLSPPPRPPKSSSSRLGIPRSSPARSSPRTVVDLTDSDDEGDKDMPMAADVSSPCRGSPFSSKLAKAKHNETDMSWLLDDDDDNVGLAIVSSSPPDKSSFRPADSTRSQGNAVAFVSQPRRPIQQNCVDTSIIDFSDEMDAEDLSVQVISTSSPSKDVASASISSSAVAFTQPVRFAGGRRRRLAVNPPSDADPSSSPQVASIIAPPRKGKKEKRHDRRPSYRRIEGAWDDAAIHSGQETSAGSSGDEESEHESDREFLKDLPETQVSPSYAQTQVYRQSLLSQAPGGSKAPLFAKPPKRRGPFAEGKTSSRHRAPVLLSSSPGQDPNEYEFDSFLVEDDAAIMYETDED